MLASLFILLFLFYLFNGQVLALPLDQGGLSLDSLIILQIEFLSELLIDNEVVVSKIEDNGKVISAFLIDDVDVLDGLQEGLVIGADLFLDEVGIGQHFVPVIGQFPGSQVVLDFLDFLLGEVLVKVFQVILCDRFFALHDAGDILQDGGIEFEVALLQSFGLLRHFILNLPNFLVSFIDGQRPDLLRQGELLDRLFHILQRDLTLFLNKQKGTKKSNINNECLPLYE